MPEQNYTSQAIPLSFRTHGGGLNTTASPIELAKNESPDLQNTDFDKFGSFLKRNGYAQLNTSAANSGATWTSLHWLQLSSGTDYIMGTCGNKLMKQDALDGTWDDVTGALTITAGNNNHWRWRTYRDTAIGVNGVNVCIKWTGSGNGAVLTVPTNMDWAKYVEVFRGYTLLANVSISSTVAGSRLYWSTVGTIETWVDADNTYIARDDGSDITGLAVLGDKLIIFKEFSIHYGLFTGDRDIPFIFDKTNSVVGCISGDSIQSVENGLVFQSQDGFYYFDGNNSYKLSDRITTTLDEDFDKSRYANTQSIYQRTKNRYWATTTTSGGTTNNRCLTWDSSNNAWSRYKGHNANCFVIVNTSGQERLYFGDYAGFVYRADTSANDIPSGVSTAIDSYFYTKWHDYDDMVNSKGTPHIYAYYRLNSATCTFAYSYDFEDGDTYTQTFSTTGGAALYGTAVYGVDTYAGAGGAVTRLDLTGRGRVIRFKFANSTLSEEMQIDGFGAEAYAETNV